MKSIFLQLSGPDLKGESADMTYGSRWLDVLAARLNSSPCHRRRNRCRTASEAKWSRLDD